MHPGADDAFGTASVERRRSVERLRGRAPGGSAPLLGRGRGASPASFPSRGAPGDAAAGAAAAPRWAPAVFVWNRGASAEAWAAVRGGVEVDVGGLERAACPAPGGAGVFALLHNALRAEAEDLQALLNAFARARLNLTLGMLHDLAAWWLVFERFLLTYFNLEDAVLLPWAAAADAAADAAEAAAADAAGAAADAANAADAAADAHAAPAPAPAFPGAAPPAERAATARAMESRRARLEHLANEVSNALVLFRCRPSGEVLPLLYRSTHAFLPRLSAYLLRQHTQLVTHPTISAAPPAETAALTARVFAFIRAAPGAPTHLALLQRAAPRDDPHVAALLREHVRGVARVRLAAHARSVAATHLRLPALARKRFADQPRWPPATGAVREGATVARPGDGGVAAKAAARAQAVSASAAKAARAQTPAPPVAAAARCRTWLRAGVR